MSKIKMSREEMEEMIRDAKKDISSGYLTASEVKSAEETIAILEAELSKLANTAPKQKQKSANKAAPEAKTTPVPKEKSVRAKRAAIKKEIALTEQMRAAGELDGDALEGAGNLLQELREELDQLTKAKAKNEGEKLTPGMIYSQISKRLEFVVENAVESEFAYVSKHGGSYETAMENVYDMVANYLGDVYADPTIDGIISAIEDSSQMQGWRIRVDRIIKNQTNPLDFLDPDLMGDVKTATDNLNLVGFLEALTSDYEGN